MTGKKDNSAIEKKKKSGKFNGKVYTCEENLELVEKKLNRVLDKAKELVELEVVEEVKKKKLRKKCEAISKQQ